MTARPAWQPPPTEGDTEPERFKNLLARLLRVPKREVDELREGEGETARKQKRKPG